MTRRLRTIALGAASALLLGLGTIAATPATAAGSLQVVNTTEYTDGNGTRHIFGEVVNNGADPVAALVDLALYDADNNLVGPESGEVFLAVVAPHGRAPFEVQPSASYSRFEATATAADPTPPYNHAFTVTKRPDFVDSASGVRHIVGDVRNNNTTASSAVSVVLTFTNATGGVIGAEAIGIGDLAAGASDSFDIPVNTDFAAYEAWSAVAESATPASGDGAEPPPATGTDADPTVTLNCNPTMRLSKKIVNVGTTTTVTVAGAVPGSKIALEGYSRPSTEYAPIRLESTVAPDGTITPIAVRPPTSARVRLQVSGCSTPGTGQVISVIPGLGITVTRVGPLKYRFDGKIIPGKQNTGRAISLYIGRGTATPVKKVVARSLADGRYSATVVLARGATRAYWATGADMTNLAGKSAVKAFSAF